MNYKVRTSKEGKTYISVIAPYIEADFYYAVSHENSNMFFIYRNGKYQHKGALGFEQTEKMLDRLNKKVEKVQAVY